MNSSALLPLIIGLILATSVLATPAPSTVPPVTPVWAASAWPLKAEQRVTTPPLCHKHVGMLQNFLTRSSAVTALKKGQEFSGCFDQLTSDALKQFQESIGISSNLGILDEATAIKVVDNLLDDHWVDNGYWPEKYQWKIHLPVHKDRDLDTVAKFSLRIPQDHTKTKTVDLYMMAKTAGQYKTEKVKSSGNRNEFTFTGATPSGVLTLDFVVPNNDLGGFGPWNLNKALRGVQGNAAIYWNVAGSRKPLYPTVRSGVYFHTGYWRSWRDFKTEMPISHGCVHVHPAGIKMIADVMAFYGIQPTNMYGGFPLQERGILSVEVMHTPQQEALHAKYLKAYNQQDNAIVNNPFVLGGISKAAREAAKIIKATPPDPLGPWAGSKNPNAKKLAEAERKRYNLPQLENPSTEGLEAGVLPVVGNRRNNNNNRRPINVIHRRQETEIDEFEPIEEEHKPSHVNNNGNVNVHISVNA